MAEIASFDVLIDKIHPAVFCYCQAMAREKGKKREEGEGTQSNKMLYRMLY